jgi:hypothetical protein
MDASPSVGEFWKVLLLRTDAFESVRRSKAGLWLSLRLFVVAGLIASIGLLSSGLTDAGRSTFSDRLSTAAAALEHAAAGWPQQWTPNLAAAMSAAADRLQGAAAAIVSVQPPLGSGASQSLRAIGAWVGQPFLSLATWVAAMLPVLVAARLMGGRGSLRQQVSLILLAFLPQALVFLSSFDLEPGSTAAAAAAALRIGAGVWSLAILLTALAVANGFSRGQSAKVVLVTAVVLAAIAALLGLLGDRLAGPLLSLLL